MAGGTLSRAYWFKHIKKQAESGLNQTDCCKLPDLNLGTFRTWIYRQRDEQKSPPEEVTSMSFVEVSTSPPATQPFWAASRLPPTQDLRLTRGIACLA